MHDDASVEGATDRPTSAALPLAGQLAATVTRLRRVLRRATRRALPYEPLSRSQIDLLHLIARRPAISVAAAAVALAVAPNTASTLANEACRAGLLARDRDAADRRVARLSLTPAGVARLEAWRDLRVEIMATALAGLSEPDRVALWAGLPALERLTARLEQEPEMP